MAKLTRNEVLNSIKSQINKLKINQLANPNVKREKNQRKNTTPKHSQKPKPTLRPVAAPRPAPVTRPILPKRTQPQLIQQVSSFMLSNDHNYYLGFGGVGDALLLLATCWNDPKARVVFFANNKDFTRLFFELFNVPVFLHDNIMGQRLANNVCDFMKSHPNFKESAHLADRLDYGDWINEQKYIPRIKSYVPWVEELGKTTYNEPVLILAPSGSHREVNRQRYMNVNEYKTIVNKYLDLGYRVFATGSMSDYHMFGLISRDKFHWLTANKVYYHNEHGIDINLRQMLQIVNCASKVISMDTYLKTYTLLCNIPTIVVKTRWLGHYLPYGRDVTDWIFLNPNIWPQIKMETVEDLV